MMSNIFFGVNHVTTKSNQIFPHLNIVRFSPLGVVFLFLVFGGILGFLFFVFVFAFGLFVCQVSNYITTHHCYIYRCIYNFTRSCIHPLGSRSTTHPLTFATGLFATREKVINLFINKWGRCSLSSFRVRPLDRGSREGLKKSKLKPNSNFHPTIQRSQEPICGSSSSRPLEDHMFQGQ